MAFGQVLGCDIQENRLRVRTKNAPDFYARIQDLVVMGGQRVRQIQSLDEGAEAVFEYLQQGKHSS